MFRWVKELLSLGKQSTQVQESEELIDSRIDEILESVLKLSRAQAKQGLRVEGLENKLEGGFTEMRSEFASLAERDSSESSFNWSDLLDAMDTLEKACRSLEQREERDISAGLRGAIGRMERFLFEQAGISRINQTDGAPNGKLFRIVAVDGGLGPSDSLTTRVVRAAVLRGDKLMREGELIVNRV